MIVHDWITVENVARLATYLVDEYGYNAKQICHFLEKPWKWENEWRELEGIGTGTHGPCVECDTITDQKVGGKFICADCIPF